MKNNWKVRIGKLSMITSSFGSRRGDQKVWKKLKWGEFQLWKLTSGKLAANIAMDNGPFEDVFPIQNGDIPASYVSLPEGNFW